MIDDLRNNFKKNKFVSIDNLLTENECNDLFKQFSLFDKGRAIPLQGVQVEGSKEIYTPFPKIGIQFEERISDIVEKTCKFTYCFGRMYYKNNFLEPHLDRAACEYSITIPLSFDVDSNWSISFRNTEKNKVYKMSQPIGNGIVYEGTKLWHWRPPLKSEWSLHLFLHYVDINGKYFMHANEYTRA